jgi:hypothetical protein
MAIMYIPNTNRSLLVDANLRRNQAGTGTVDGMI